MSVTLWTIISRQTGEQGSENIDDIPCLEEPSIVEENNVENAEISLFEDSESDYDSLINRGVLPDMARTLAKEYSSDCIQSNLKYAVSCKDTSTNLPGLIVHCIKTDYVGTMKEEKAKAKERIEQRQKACNS